MEVDEVMIQSNLEGRWSGLRQFLSNNGPCSEADFEPDPNLFDMIVNIKILVIGAGGLGCELLKDLAMTGYKNISVIDMDTIDLSNLNRQFLFRTSDIGRPKATVAAEFINKRVPGCNVTPYFNKIQDFDADFYRGFNIVICGLDSVVARRWINGMLVGLLEYNDNELDQSTIIPIIDGGTEGFKGNARVIMPGLTACIECNLDLYPKQVNFPLCTLAETPRLPEHCIEYIKLMVWPNQYPFGEGVNIDGDDPKHIQWICDKASERANLYGIVGVNYRLTQGVIKHIIPAVASTNAVIAAMCANEVMKILTFCYKPMNNYTIFNDSQGIYTYTFEAEKKDDCPACSQKPINIPFALNKTLEEFIEYLKEDNRFQLKSPGLTTVLEDGNKTLYIPNIPSLEQATRPNLTKSLQELNLSFGQVINVTDSVSPKPIVFILKQPDD